MLYSWDVWLTYKLIALSIGSAVPAMIARHLGMPMWELLYAASVAGAILLGARAALRSYRRPDPVGVAIITTLSCLVWGAFIILIGGGILAHLLR